MEKSLVKPYIAIIVGVISVSFSAILVRLSEAPSGVIAFYRMLFSCLILLPVFLKGSIKQLKSIAKKDWLLSTIAGIFLAFHFILWFESLRYTSVASSTVLVTLQPLFAFIGTYFIFKERVTGSGIISIFLAIAGSVLISASDFTAEGKALYGDMLALTACALATAYLIIGQLVRKRLALTTYTFVVYSVCSFTLFIYVLLKNEKLVSYSKYEWILFTLLAVIPTLLGHSLFNWAIEWVSTTTISMAILFEPIGATVLAYYFFGETLGPWQFIGSSLVLIGLGMFLISGKSKRKRNKQSNIGKKELFE